MVFKVSEKVSMSTEMVEQIACNEIRMLVNQYPYHLSPDISVNDKSPSFDGEIIIYKNEERKKENIEGYVAIQVKGTTVKKGYNKNKDIFKHPIQNADMEVYHNAGKGVIFFVVLIDYENDRQITNTFYRAFTPLQADTAYNDIKGKSKGEKRYTFKRCVKEDMHTICKTQLKNVTAQPRALIEYARKQQYDKYSIKQINSTNIYDFEEPYEVYGVSGETELPLYASKVECFDTVEECMINIDNENINFQAAINIAEKNVSIAIENTFYILLTKKRNGKYTYNIELHEVKTIESMYKALKALKYLFTYGNLPLTILSASEFSLGETEYMRQVELLITKCVRHMQGFEDLNIPCNYPLQDDRGNLSVGVLVLAENTRNLAGEKLAEVLGIESDKKLKEKIKLNEKGITPILFHLENKSDIMLYVNSTPTGFKLLGITNVSKISIAKEKESLEPISFYSSFPEDFTKLINCINFDLGVFQDNLMQFKHENTNYNAHSQLALELIKVFLCSEDKTDLERIVVAKNILTHNLEMKQKYNKNACEVEIVHIILTNVLLRSTTDFDREFLETLAAKDDVVPRFISAVLKGHFILAKKLYDRLEEKQKELISTPIMIMFENEFLPSK